MPPHFFRRFTASDTFESKVERSITGPDDLYYLEGETFLRSRNGCIETGDTDLLQGGE